MFKYPLYQVVILFNHKICVILEDFYNHFISKQF